MKRGPSLVSCDEDGEGNAEGQQMCDANGSLEGNEVPEISAWIDGPIVRVGAPLQLGARRELDPFVGVLVLVAESGVVGRQKPVRAGVLRLLRCRPVGHRIPDERIVL